jgi:hypothetical protein
MVSTQDFESCDPSSNLGGTFEIFYSLKPLPYTGESRNPRSYYLRIGLFTLFATLTKNAEFLV